MERTRIPTARWRATFAALMTLALMLAAGATAPTAGAAPTAGTVTIGSKCLDDADFGTGNGNVIQVFTCNGSAAQNWTWQSDGTVTVYGMCLDVANASNATGALIQLYSCMSGAPEQKFSYLPDGTIYSVRSGKCLNVQGGSVVNNARIGLAPCDPSVTTEVWGAPTAPGPKYTLSAGAAVSYPNPDDTPASVFTDKNGQFYYQQSHSLYGAADSRKWTFFTGSAFDSATVAPISNAVNPTNASDSNADTTWRCNNSPTGLSATSAPAGSSYSQRNYCDLSGVWVDPDTGYWYGLVHNEFTPQPFGDGLHYDAIDYAVSQNQGSTWTIQGHAVTSPFSTTRNDTTAFPNSTYYYGDGDQRLFVDYASGYFYLFYASRALNKDGSGTIWLQHVARSPISQKMAPSSWTKWYDGAWQTPGTGGTESDIIPSEGLGAGYLAPGEDYQPATTGTTQTQVGAGTLPDNSQLAVMNIAWDAYLGKYIGTPQNNVAQNSNTLTPLHFYATSDLATEQWTDMGLVANQPNAAWYRWLLDPANQTSSTVLGKTFRSYCSFYCSTYTGEYANITIAPTSSADLPAAPVSGGVSYQVTSSDGQFLAQSGTGLTTNTASSTSALQQWKFTATGDGFYSVTNASSGLAIGVGTGDSGRAWGAPATLSTLGSSPAVGQQWSLQTVTQAPATSGASVPTGSCRLVNRYSGLALSLTTGTQAVATSPQRNWNNSGTGGDTRPATAQTLTFVAAGGTPTNTVAVTNPGNQTSQPGTAITPLQLSATDSAAGQTLAYTATGLPTGLSVNSATGKITGTPTGIGTTTVTVTATDSTDATGNVSFTWTVPGTDLASGKAATASSIEPGTSFTASLATDGNPATRWSSDYSDPQWIQVDLGATHSINEVKLSWEAAYGKAYQIQTSPDGTTWTTIYSTTTSTGGDQDLTGLSGTGRYIRVYGTTRASGYGYSLWSFQVYGS